MRAIVIATCIFTFLVLAPGLRGSTIGPAQGPQTPREPHGDHGAGTGGADTLGQPVMAQSPSGETGTARETVSLAGCPGARKGLVYYRARANEYLAMRDARLYPVGQLERTGRCPFVQWKAGQWRDRALRERRLTERWLRTMRNPIAAITAVFGAYAGQALAVARCESDYYPRDGVPDTIARNGQYLGMFQMGDWERRTYGHGSTPLAQARAAFRYFVASGRDWSPWQCRPWGLGW